MSALDPGATVTTAFTIAELVIQANKELRLITGAVPDLPAIVAIGSWDTRGPSVVRRLAPDPAWDLGPGQPERDFDLALEGRETSVLVSTAFSFNEYRGGSQWNVWVGASGDPASFVLAFAAVTAAASIGWGRVWDGDGALAPETEDGLAPQEVIDLLATPGPHASFLAACEAAVRRTGTD